MGFYFRSNNLDSLASAVIIHLGRGFTTDIGVGIPNEMCVILK